MTDVILTLKGIQKIFDGREVVAIDHLEIKKGEAVGLLGMNGAGKSTTMNLIMGLLQPSAGEICYKGQKGYAKRFIGYVPQDLALYPELTGADNLMFFGRLYRGQTKIGQNRVVELLKLVGLEEEGKRPVYTYSGGMKRRLNIAASLMHDPELIVMDEPTVGIDPQSREQIYTIINHLKAQDKTLIYTSHYMSEVEALCERVIVMSKGHILIDGKIQTLLARLEEGVLDLSVAVGQGDAARKVLSNLTSVRLQDDSEGDFCRVVLSKPPQVLIGEVMSVVSEAAIQVEDFHYKKPTLDTLFLTLTGGV